MLKYCISLGLIGLFSFSHAQDLKGLWVEVLHNGTVKYAEIEVKKHSGGDVLGRDFDTSKEPEDPYKLETGRCEHEFNGVYDASTQLLIIHDSHELYTTKNHIPNHLELYYSKAGGKEYLEGYIYGQSRLTGEVIRDEREKVRYVRIPEEQEESYAENKKLPKYLLLDTWSKKSYEDLIETNIDFTNNGWQTEDEYSQHEMIDIQDYTYLVDIKDIAPEYIVESILKGDDSYFSEEEYQSVDEYSTANPVIITETEITDSPDNPYFSEEELETVTIPSESPTTDMAAYPEGSLSEAEEIAEKPIEETPSTESIEASTQEPVEIAEIEEMLPEPESEAISESEEEVVEEAVAPEEAIYEQEPITSTQKIEIEEKYASRNTKTIANIRTEDKVLKIVVKDYGEQDGDLISIIVDGKVLYRKLPITTLQKNLEIVLASDRKQNEIIFVAENLGRVPPNTARIEMFLNGKKYSYSLLTDTKTNAKIVLLRD